MKLEEAIKVANNLAPCPFCGSPLHFNAERFRVKGVVPNPSARCHTEGCFGTSLPVVSLDVPEQVAAWNRRAPLSGWQVPPQELTEDNPLFKSRVPEAAAQQLATVLAWLTECQLATLEYLQMVKRTPKSELSRQQQICDQAVAQCKDLGVSPRGLHGDSCPRLAERLQD